MVVAVNATPAPGSLFILAGEFRRDHTESGIAMTSRRPAIEAG
jgi:hypothetical protein